MRDGPGHGIWLATAPVVLIETVALTAEGGKTLSEDGTEQVDGSIAPVGPPTLQPRLTVPVKPFCGTIEIVEAPFPPRATVMVLPTGINAMFGVAATAIMLVMREVSDERALPFHDGFRTPYVSAAPYVRLAPVD